ncbi:unnamed protein product [Calypogeia fissa]
MSPGRPERRFEGDVEPGMEEQNVDDESEDQEQKKTSTRVNLKDQIHQIHDALRQGMDKLLDRSVGLWEEILSLTNEVEFWKNEWQQTLGLRKEILSLKGELEKWNVEWRQKSGYPGKNVSSNNQVEQLNTESIMADQARKKLEAQVANLLRKTKIGNTRSTRPPQTTTIPSDTALETQTHAKVKREKMEAAEEETKRKEEFRKKEKDELWRKEKEELRNQDLRRNYLRETNEAAKQKKARDRLMTQRKECKESERKRKVGPQTDRRFKRKKQSSDEKDDDDEEPDHDYDPKAYVQHGKKGQQLHPRKPSPKDPFWSQPITHRRFKRKKQSSDAKDDDDEEPDHDYDPKAYVQHGKKGQQLHPRKPSPKDPFRSQPINHYDHDHIPQHRVSSPTPSASSTTSSEQDSDEEEDQILVPDPDFHDFDSLRTENHIRPGQIWAIYDHQDGMPRLYARIVRVSSRPFKAYITWLDHCPSTDEEKKWAERSELSLSCGDFRLGRSSRTMHQVNTFSHFVMDKAARGVQKIYPKKGQVWAVYKGPEQEMGRVGCKYEMVEILSELCDETGVRTGKLVKVEGFKSVFHRQMEMEKARSFKPVELVYFSHSVPNKRIADSETDAHGIPRGSLELDPASTPAHLMMVDRESAS